MPLAAALARGKPLLADGAFATTLFAAGLPLGTAPETWLRDRPKAVLALHRGFVAAGADILLTGTFGAGRAVIVAGSLGPPGDPRAMPEDAIADRWRDQAAALVSGGVDVLWFETLSCLAEVRAAARVAREIGCPFVATATFPARGLTLAGLAPAAMAAALAGLSPRPLAIGANCGAGPDDLLMALAWFVAARTGLPLVAKPGAGLPVLEDGRLVYPVAPAGMAAFARTALAMGATIVGGCCGTTRAHLSAMRHALDAEEPAPPRLSP